MHVLVTAYGVAELTQTAIIVQSRADNRIIEIIPFISFRLSKLKYLFVQIRITLSSLPIGLAPFISLINIVTYQDLNVNYTDYMNLYPVVCHKTQIPLDN